MPKLTRTMIDKTPLPTTGDKWLWDSEVEGFGVRIRASGRRSYLVRYRAPDLKQTQRKMTLGRVSDMAPEKARDLARKVFTQVAEGIDPMAAKRERDAAPTMADLAERFIREHSRPFKKERSAYQDEAIFRNYVTPAIGTKLVADVTRADMLKLHGSLSEKKATANGCLAALSKAFNLAEDWEWRPRNSNPVHGVKKYKLQVRELILTPEQVRDLRDSLYELRDAGEIGQSMVDLVQLILLTGCRLREIMDSPLSWVDRERNLLVLPDSKVGARRIPLAPAAMAIIDAMPKGQIWLIPGRNHGRPMITPYKPWARIKEYAGLPPELRIHDLRHTVGSLGHMAGLSQRQIATLLGHSQLSTTERYLHGAAGEAALLAEKMGDLITGAWGDSKAA